MDFLSDSVVEAFFYFRLGNQAILKEMLYHFSLQVEREIYQQKDLTIEKKEDESCKSNDENVGLIPNGGEFYTKVSHNHQCKHGNRTMTLTTKPTSFEQFQQSPLVQSLGAIRSVRVMIISDTHERHSTLGKLPPCDVLIHAGDILMTSRVQSVSKAKTKLKKFNDWMKEQDASYKVVIGGNHDKVLEELSAVELQQTFTDCTYLCNSGIDAMGLKIWASPCSQGASDNRAFQSKEFRAAAEDAARMLGQVDILVTHGTCTTLQNIVRPRLMHVFGHYHCFHGLHMYDTDYANLVSVAAPIMDHNYDPHNLPIVIDCHINDTVIDI